MPVNKVLAPIGEHNTKDFAPANNQIGWVKMTNNTASGLIEISDNILQDRERANLGDHAIPSPIAHIKHFKNRLDSGDQSALNEWRGMLAVIALQDINGYDVSIQDIPLYPDGDGNPTVLGKVICEDLVNNSNVTGYKVTGYDIDGNPIPDIKKLSVFCKNGQPFAMYMPSMLICPFKRYSIDLFNDVSWYSNQGTPGDANADPKGTWNEVRPEITDNPAILSATAKKFYFWLEGVEPGQVRITHFKDYILGDAAVPQPTQESATIPCAAYRNHVDLAGAANLTKICPSPIREKVFADKLLFIIPPSDLYEGGDYQICRNGITPQKKTFDGVCNGPVLVIPPIHKDLINSVCNGSKILNSWSIDYRNGEYTCRVNITVSDTNQVFERKSVFKPTQVTWTNTMPYLSMWPYVNFKRDSWKENYIAISAIDEPIGNESESLGDYEGLTRNIVCTRLLGKQSNLTELARCPEIKISAVTRTPDAGIKRYKVKSRYQSKEFTILRSESAPYALDFSYSYADETYSLGCWVIDGSLEADEQNFADNHIVAMDFGTTSTNVFLKSKLNNSEPKSMSSAGKYLHNIYNPYVKHEAMVNKLKNYSDFLQDYYLFSSKGDTPLGKIFTYGQNFDAIEIRDDGTQLPVDGTIPNITGRMVVVDDTFLLSDIPEGESRIYNNLKLPINGVYDPEREKAGLNFIYSTLMYAVLEAKANGASKIDLRLSYPSDKQGNAVLNIANKLKTYLTNASGCNVTVRCETEASSAGQFFKNLGNALIIPNPLTGYVIVDIGGGTTDVSFWKGDLNNAQLKAEQSFAYAGNYLVIRSVLQGLSSGTSFSDMWLQPINGAQSPVAKAIEKYSRIPINGPLPINWTANHLKKASLLDFLLEKGEIRSDRLSDPTYQNFVSAIRLKYYALFYLIANYMQRNNNIEIDKELGFKVYLAGCGSKGIETFAKHGDTSFAYNVSKMFCELLGVPVDEDRIGLVEPQNKNKEEVVIGLTWFGDKKHSGGHVAPPPPVNLDGDLDDLLDGLLDDGADFATAPATPAPAVTSEPVAVAEPAVEFEAIDPKAFNEKAALRAYENLLTKLREYESDSQLLERLSCLPQINPENFRKSLQIFRPTWQVIKNDLDRDDVDYDPNTYAEHFALLMLENMINYLI